MSVPSELLHEKLGRQHDPEPPEQVSAPPPSLLMYVALLLVAAALVFSAHAAGKLDLPGLYVNLASDIMGAVLILIVVEHRLRRREVAALQHAPHTAGLYVALACSTQMREVFGYARVLSTRMEAVAKPYYLARPELEAAVGQRIESGLMLLGGARTGKSTLLHRIVRRQAVEAMRNPRMARVPVLVPSRNWNEGGVVEALFDTMRSYFAVSPQTFRNLLKRRRLLCVFDSVDEALRPAERMRAIGEFRQKHPGNAVLLSSRPLNDGSLDATGLPAMEIPPLTANEAAKVLELRMRSEDHAPGRKGASSCPSP